MMINNGQRFFNGIPVISPSFSNEPRIGHRIAQPRINPNAVRIGEDGEVIPLVSLFDNGTRAEGHLRPQAIRSVRFHNDT